MIYDRLSNLSAYVNLIPSLKTVARILEEEDLMGKETGFHETDDPLVRYNIIDYTTGDVNPLAETHQKEADVQIVLSGSEYCFFTPGLGERRSVSGYDANTDVELFSSKEERIKLPLSPGMFAIFLPGEMHMGNGVNGSVSKNRKVVFKIKI